MEVAVTRFVAVRVPAAADRIELSNRYLDRARDSVSADLAALGGFFRVTAADTLAMNVALDRALELTAAST